jgi:hypothetical protein
MKRTIARWFIFSGCFGVAVALGLYALGSVDAVRTRGLVDAHVQMMLAPAMILGLAEPKTFGEKITLLVVVLGSNFILYGVLGLALRALVFCGRFFLRRITPSRT